MFDSTKAFEFFLLFLNGSREILISMSRYPMSPFAHWLDHLRWVPFYSTWLSACGVNRRAVSSWSYELCMSLAINSQSHVDWPLSVRFELIYTLHFVGFWYVPHFGTSHLLPFPSTGSWYQAELKSKSTFLENKRLRRQFPHDHGWHVY